MYSGYVLKVAFLFFLNELLWGGYFQEDEVDCYLSHWGSGGGGGGGLSLTQGSWVFR